ncbi:MAG: polysaccharide biosynthesis/export family protein [Acidobacteriaceae bacterium]|nr:polysaccharide biosynthesis/export family protein [Acidobacteriaceae bacterium]MBV9499872.1 polysaccharide biosynthesis/export family protein [Acidobacteriaceae bacterium]
MKTICLFLCLLLGGTLQLPDQLAAADREYVLGPDDGVSVNVVDLAELDQKALGVVRVDHEGNIHLPLAGRLKAAGLTVEQLEKQIASRLSGIMNNPEVSVSIAEYRNHPVSVLGAVRNPGVYQVSGRKTLFEVLSLAGGLNPDAGNQVKITRQISAGRLPLPGVTTDQSGGFEIGQLDVRKVMEAKNPDENIEVLPNDVITVPKAELIYVVGAVHRAGGFPLVEKQQISVLQAVSLAEGLDATASAKNARILRESVPGAERKELHVNVGEILDGRAKDVALQANDILFIPVSIPKSASIRALEAGVQAATGIAVFGR